jgi:tRNA (mo5U34)-methyltransferase
MDEDVFLSATEAESLLRQTVYWHYPFDLPWGRSAASKPGTEDRHDLRRRHFFEPLLAAYGGSLGAKRVLDLGCCQGHWTFEAARAGAARCLGLDSSETFIAESRALRTLFGLVNTEFRCVHLEDDRWWDGLRPFDVTLFLGLFYHLADPISVLRRAMALTRETMVIDTVVQPRAEPLLILVRRNPEEPTTRNSGLSTGIRIKPTPAALLALLEDGGFARTEVLPVRGPMPPDYASGRRISLLARR